MNRRQFMLGAPLLVAGCGEAIWAPDDIVRSMEYTHDGPPRLTLMTMRNVGSGNGAHTSLMINASQRVIWDPAGSFRHPDIPERNDVIIGVTPQIAEYYVSYHSRATYYTVIQEIDVSPAVAEMALQAALSDGPVPKSMCAASTSRLLSGLPGFESIGTTFFPVTLENRFAKLPNVRTREVREYDSDDNSGVLYRINVTPLR